MRCPDAIEDEAGRLRALSEYALKSGVHVAGLQPLVEIAANLFGTTGAAVNMIGSDEVFFAASTGLGGETDMRRSISFCAHAILQEDVMVVEDATFDPRFHDNPLVTQGQIRFYAGVPLRTPSGHALGVFCVVDPNSRAHFSEQDRDRLKDLARVVSDRLELRRIELARQMQPAHFASLAASSPSAMAGFDGRGCIRAWNKAAHDLLGYPEAEVMGKSLTILMPAGAEAKLEHVIDQLSRNALPEQRATDALVLVARDGTHKRVHPIWSRWDAGDKTWFGLLMQPVDHAADTAEMLHRLSNYDSLTGLPNRHLFCEAVATALQGEAGASLIVIDIDGYKDVNDTMGHPTGDRILRELACRIRDCVGPDAMVARIGGDEFAVMLPGVSDVSSTTVADRMIGTLSGPILVDNQEVRVTASCGLAIAPLHGDRVEDLLASADLALFQAKTRGRATSFMYVPALRSEAIARRMFDAELHRAVERGEFELHYQPQISLSDGRLSGAEALIRWHHPIRGLLSPSAFLPSVETSALAVEIGRWVLGTALERTAAWRAVLPSFRMGVNLFAAQFGDDNLVADVRRLLERHGLAGDALEIEITENIAIGREGLLLPKLRALRQLGVRLALDDFGTGYASLNLLKNFPISRIKIDKSFTQALSESEMDRTIITALVDLGHKIGLEVVVEGVENRRQIALLANMGCDEGQGFLFGRPVPSEIFEERHGLGVAASVIKV